MKTLSQVLRETTEEMANCASVDMTLWCKHSGAVLTAASLIEEMERQSAVAKKDIDSLHEALEAKDAELREERCLCLENRDAADASVELLRRMFRGDHGLCVCTADNWKVTHLLCNQHALEAFLRGHDALAKTESNQPSQ